MEKLITVRVSDLEQLTKVFENFIYEDEYSRDRCSFCSAIWGNIKYEKLPLKHDLDCPVLVAQDLSTRLHETDSIRNAKVGK